jgi:hypothetical protein
VLEAVARAVVAQVEADYVAPTKAASGSDKLTPPQQSEAQRLAQGEVKDQLAGLGVPASGSTAPLVGAAIEKAVENAKKTLPKATQETKGTST